MSAAIRITWTKHTAEELRMTAAKSSDGACVRRLLALSPILEGHSREEAARQAGMDHQTLRDWVHRYNKHGEEGRCSIRIGGRSARLSKSQMEALNALMLEGPDLAKHKVVRWRCVDPRDEVARRFAVKVYVRTIGKWLRQLGLTRLQPRLSHPKRDETGGATLHRTSPGW